MKITILFFILTLTRLNRRNRKSNCAWRASPCAKVHQRTSPSVVGRLKSNFISVKIAQCKAIIIVRYLVDNYSVVFRDLALVVLPVASSVLEYAPAKLEPLLVFPAFRGWLREPPEPAIKVIRIMAAHRRLPLEKNIIKFSGCVRTCCWARWARCCSACSSATRTACWTARNSSAVIICIAPGSSCSCI